VYLVRLMLQWVKSNGGAQGMAKRNDAKTAELYGAIDRLSAFYRCPVEKDARSSMNVVFRLPTPQLEELFVGEAEAQGLVGLKGHRSAGGIRVSLYNAVSLEDVKALTAFMTDFAKRKG
jgi:phosphoserine aminotransferase